MNSEEKNKEEIKKLEETDEAKELKVIKEKLAKCEQEKEDYLNGWKRAKADFINYQKDEGKRFDELLKFGQMEMIKEFITVLDSFDLALEAIEKNVQDQVGKSFIRGIYMIRTQLEEILKKRGLEKMIIALGQPFDPSLQEAIAEEESEQPPGTIIEEIERGYLLNGRVIRPARVKIAKAKK